MDFVVDKVSEDTFYINLLLGLPKLLDKYKKFGVTFSYVSRRLPISHSDICAWEHKHGVLLPEDLRNFYNSSDGFLFTWFLNLGHDKSTITGKIEINNLNDLVLVFGHQVATEAGVNTDADRFDLKLGTTSKLYELVSNENGNKIVLIYLNSRYAPTIWIKTTYNKFYFLSDDFTTFCRMAVAHLGIPNWYLLFTPQGVPQWTEGVVRLLAPNLLNPKHTIEDARRNREKRTSEEFPELYTNKLDLNIFKCLPKSYQGMPRIIEREKFQTTIKTPRKKRNEYIRNDIKAPKKIVQIKK